MTAQSPRKNDAPTNLPQENPEKPAIKEPQQQPDKPPIRQKNPDQKGINPDNKGPAQPRKAGE